MFCGRLVHPAPVNIVEVQKLPLFPVTERGVDPLLQTSAADIDEYSILPANGFVGAGVGAAVVGFGVGAAVVGLGVGAAVVGAAVVGAAVVGAAVVGADVVGFGVGAAVVGADVVGAGVVGLQFVNDPPTYNILLFGFGELIEATVTLVTLESLVIGAGKSTYVIPSADAVAGNDVIKLPPLYAFNVILTG